MANAPLAVSERESNRYRKLLAVAGCVYLFWWPVVELMLPGSFNPVGSRLAVVGFCFLSLALSLRLRMGAALAPLLLMACSWLITSHYFYLFYRNADDFNWVVGCYITVAATGMCQLTRGAVYAYSLFVLALGAWLSLAKPEVRNTIFFPGLLTIVGLVCLGIVLRLNAERRLTESSERFKNLFDSVYEGILLHRNGVILDLNLALAKIFGYEKEEVIGKSLFEFIAPESVEWVRSKILSHSELPYEAVGLRKDGTPVAVEVRGRFFRNEGETVRLTAIRDITDRKAAERDHALAQGAQRAIQIRDEFISIASHELKTPLTTMKLMVEMGLKRAAKRDAQPWSLDQVRGLLNGLGRSIRRLQLLIEDMLDVSRVSAGKLSVRLEAADLSEIVRDALKSLQPEITASGTSVELLSDGPLIWNIDRFRFEQVMVNLLTNALKYGAGKPVQIRLSRLESGEAVIRVKDQGIGIPEESLGLVFNRFERAISSQHISGLGLGLYISLEIVRAHGGQIEVQSALGHGSEFTVTLPRLNSDIVAESEIKAVS